MGHMRSKALLAVAGVLSFLVSALAAGNPESAGDAAHLFRYGVGARARALGGAYVALADDVTALFWNPAGLVQTSSIRLGGTHESRYGGLVVLDSVGLAITNQRWGTGFLWCHSDLYSTYQGAIAVASHALAVGITAKVYQFAVHPQVARGVGLDVGVLYRTTVHDTVVAVGLVSRDLGWTTITWEGVGGQVIDRTAWVTRIGMTTKIEGSLVFIGLSADLEVALRRPPYFNEQDYIIKTIQLGSGFGVELGIEAFTMRAGLAWLDMQKSEDQTVRLTLGTGVRFNGVILDAGWVLAPLGGTYLLSVEFLF